MYGACLAGPKPEAAALLLLVTEAAATKRLEN
jgi:hypothetical protein